MCSAYPLHTFDTIDPRSGELDSRSALNLIVFGVSVTVCRDISGVLNLIVFGVSITLRRDIQPYFIDPRSEELDSRSALNLIVFQSPP